MREILKTGKDILSISFSSALSTTYQSSVIAAEELKDEFPDAKILTVDSLCACLLYTSPSPRDVEESRMPSSA